MAFQWTIEAAEATIRERGYVVCIGQIDARVRRQLDRLARTGAIAKWKACWNAPLGGFGLGNPRTVYGRPEFNPHREQVAS